MQREIFDGHARQSGDRTSDVDGFHVFCFGPGVVRFAPHAPEFLDGRGFSSRSFPDRHRRCRDGRRRVKTREIPLLRREHLFVEHVGHGKRIGHDVGDTSIVFGQDRVVILEHAHGHHGRFVHHHGVANRQCRTRQHEIHTVQPLDHDVLRIRGIDGIQRRAEISIGSFGGDFTGRRAEPKRSQVRFDRRRRDSREVEPGPFRREFRCFR